MEFHEGYWVTIGTAAPVIALALCVAANTSGAAIWRKIGGTRRNQKQYQRIHRQSALFAAFGLLMTLFALCLALVALATGSDLGRFFILGGFFTVVALVAAFAVMTTDALAAPLVKSESGVSNDDAV